MSQVTSQNALVKDSTVHTLNGKLDNLNATLGGNANIAPIFNTATAYSKGDMVNYNGDLYVFTANHAAGAWIGSDAVQTKVSTEISSLKSGLTDLEHNRLIKVCRESIDSASSITVQLGGSRLYQYYTFRDDPSYVGFGIIDTNYNNGIYTTPLITTNLVTFTDSGNGVLTIANVSDYTVYILLIDISASFV